MPRAGSPKRHAQAVLQLALRDNSLDRWLVDLRRLEEVAANATYRVVLESPRLSLQEKLSLLQEPLQGLDQRAVNLLALLASRGRLRLLPGIVAEYRRLVNAQRGLEEAEVITAIPLEEAEVNALVGRLEAIAGKKVAVSARVDPAILGGLVARVGDRLLDGSLRSRLHSLRKSLAEARR